MTIPPALFGVLAIGGAFAGALLFLLLILRSNGLRSALNSGLRLPLLIALVAIGLGLSALTIHAGTSPSVPFAIMVAAHLLMASDAPKERWARPAMWLSGAVLAAATACSWFFLREFLADPLWLKALAAAVTGYVLWVAALSLLRLFRPPQTPIAETGTPA